MTTHASLDCPYCDTCEKYGHEKSKCCLGLNNKKDTDTETAVEEDSRSMDTTQPTAPEDKSTAELLKEPLKNKIDKEQTQAPRKEKRKRKKPAAKGQVKKNPPCTMAMQMNSDHITLTDSYSEDEFEDDSDSGTWVDVVRKRKHSDAPDPCPAAPRPPKR